MVYIIKNIIGFVNKNLTAIPNSWKVANERDHGSFEPWSLEKSGKNVSGPEQFA